MGGWTDVLAVDSEPILGSPDPFRSAEQDLRCITETLADALMGLGAVFAIDGFSGLAADGFMALTTELQTMIRPLLPPLTAAADALGVHADDLDDLIVESGRQLARANGRRQRLDDLERRVDQQRLLFEAGIEGAAIELDHAERRRYRAAGDLHDSLLDYRRLRADEEALNRRTTRTLESHELVLPALVRSSLGSWPGSGGVNAVWPTLRSIFLNAGIDVALPSNAEVQAHPSIRIDGDGQQVVFVDGPLGGEFVVGRDITAEVFDVVLSLLGGWLPPFRPFGDVNELTDDEFSAINWAYSQNFGAGESPQLQMGGVNGSWDSYLSGGEWAPQQIVPMDGMAFASMLAPNGAASWTTTTASARAREQRRATKRPGGRSQHKPKEGSRT